MDTIYTTSPYSQMP